MCVEASGLAVDGAAAWAWTAILSARCWRRRITVEVMNTVNSGNMIIPMPDRTICNTLPEMVIGAILHPMVVTTIHENHRAEE